MKNVTVDYENDVPIKDLRGAGVRKRNGHNNSISHNPSVLPKDIKRNLSKNKSQARSKKNLLVQSHDASGIKRRGGHGPTTDDEKFKMHSNRARNPQALAKHKTKNMRDPYESDAAARHRRYAGHVSQTVKKHTSKVSLSQMYDKVNAQHRSKGNLSLRNKNNAPQHRGPKGNISVDMYNRANQLESKTRRNQEARLQNILKMHDSNMKKGMGIAHKGRRL